MSTPTPEIIAAKFPEDLNELCAFDEKAFAKYPGDVFPREKWGTLQAFWMVQDGIRVGCTALLRDSDYCERPFKGCLFIESTAVLPEFEHQGLGRLFKEWQIKYARQHGFDRIVTTMRQSNTRIRKLNERFGFQYQRTLPGYYGPLEEPAIVMELQPAFECPFCEKPLRTPRAKQCRFCHRDWH